MNELLDLFITAQEKNKEISQIIGNDIKSFCDNFFAEVPKISKIREFLDSLKQLAWVLVLGTEYPIMICCYKMEAWIYKSRKKWAENNKIY